MNTKNKNKQLLQLAADLKAARNITSMSQEKLALESGLDRSYISRLERGIANPTYLALQSIAKALGTPLSSILRS
ncbi:helix-turn-helix domain-containing protein [bacterium]|nr:helix-turn-helix domain-containing protein [bacterium]